MFAVIVFRCETAEADFLFGSDITSYIDEVFNQALDIREAHLEYRDSTQETPPDYDHAKIVAAMHKLEKWFVGQHDIARPKFKPYLDVSQIK